MRLTSFFQNGKLVLLLLCSLLVIMIIGVYLLAIIPLKDDLKAAKSELVQQEKQLELIQIGPGLEETRLEESTAALQKKVPIQPLLEQFLLNLEQAETVSNSLITSMTFSEGNEQGVTDNATNTTDALGDQEQIENNTEVEGQENLPTGIKKLTAYLTIQSPGYFELEQFIDSLENLDRITKVEQIAFSGFPEIITTNEGVEELIYSVTVSTYYYPELVELIEFDPELDAPEPSNKNNPLVPYKND